MSENKKILYILIGTGPKPLAGYSEKTGDFVGACENQLSRCQKNKSAAITGDNYKIYYENIDNVTYLVMTMPDYPMPAAISCIESLKKEFSTDLHGRNFAIVGNYGLNNEMKEKLKMKYEYYNENTEIVDEKIEQLKGVMAQYQTEVFKAAKELDIRKEKLEEMQNKAKDLENDSYNFKKGAIKVRKFECSKKVKCILAMVVIVIIIVVIIVLTVMPSSSGSSGGDGGSGPDSTDSPIHSDTTAPGPIDPSDSPGESDSTSPEPIEPSDSPLESDSTGPGPIGPTDSTVETDTTSPEPIEPTDSPGETDTTDKEPDKTDKKESDEKDKGETDIDTSA